MSRIMMTRSLQTILRPPLLASYRSLATRWKEREEQVDDSNTFGSEKEVLDSEYLTDDDDEYDRLEMMKRRRPLSHYNFLLWRLRDAGGPEGMKKAIQVFERMFREDRHQPERNHFTIMISGCAEFGLVDKAFYFFDLMRKRGMKPTQATVTALLNACAESRNREKGLEKLEVITEWIRETSYPCNMLQYNAMVKAYAKQGDLRSAFAVMKDMGMEGHEPNDHTYCMLLMGCITDRDSGLSHAIRIIRQMRKQMPVTVHAVNLLLRVVRDSGFGSEDHLRKLIPGPAMQNITLLPSTRTQSSELQIVSVSSELLTPPVDLLREYFPKTRVCLDASSLNVASNRLALIGGFAGIMRLMDEANIKPTVATIGALVDCIPDTLQAENELVRQAEERGVVLSTDVFNKLIKRRAKRKDLTSAKQTVRDMQLRGVNVDIVTFGAMAVGCHRRDLGLQLMKDMQSAGFKLNKEIGGALVHGSCFIFDFDYLTDVLMALEGDAVRPDPKMLERIEDAKLKAEKALIRKERGQEVENHFRNLTSDSLDRFKLFHSSWLRRNRVDFPEPEERQFDFKIAPNPRQKMFDFEKDMRRRISEVRGQKFYTARRVVDGVDVERALERENS